MFIVGLTGGISTGKSTVAEIIRSIGTPVIDADVIARAVVEPGKPAWKKIKREFGDSVISEDGTINRAKLGEIIFSDPAKRKLLNTISHPYIERMIVYQVIMYFFKGYQFVVLDLPLLFETHVFMEYIYKTIVVSCDGEIQLERLIRRNQFSTDEAEKRIAAQMPMEKKCQMASFVIDNNGSMAETRRQMEKIHELLQRSKHHWRLRILFLGWWAALGLFALWIYSQIPPKRSNL